jgi:hypothetical protein
MNEESKALWTIVAWFIIIAPVVFLGIVSIYCLIFGD